MKRTNLTLNRALLIAYYNNCVLHTPKKKRPYPCLRTYTTTVLYYYTDAAELPELKLALMKGTALMNEAISGEHSFFTADNNHLLSTCQKKKIINKDKRVRCGTSPPAITSLQSPFWKLNFTFIYIRSIIHYIDVYTVCIFLK